MNYDYSAYTVPPEPPTTTNERKGDWIVILPMESQLGMYRCLVFDIKPKMFLSIITEVREYGVYAIKMGDPFATPHYYTSKQFHNITIHEQAV